MSKMDSRTAEILANCRQATPAELAELQEERAIVALSEPVEFSTEEDTKSGNGVNRFLAGEIMFPSAEDAGWVRYERCYRPGFYEEGAPGNRDFTVFWNIKRAVVSAS